MNLKDRLLASGMTVAEAAGRAGTPPAHLYNILNRIRRPKPPLAKAIEAATNGVIRAAVLLELEPEPSDPPPHQPSPVLDEVS
jgi:transcriptional regulator with XRE-family HTH domain